MSLVRNVLEALTPYDVPLLMMARWGPEDDGGYVVPSELMKRCTLLVTGGVGDNVKFEAEVAMEVPAIRIALFDHTIESLPLHAPPGAIWHKVGLATREEEGFTTLESACRQAGFGEDDTLAVKLDIEGAEWEVLASVSEELLGKISVLIIEYHHFGQRDKWASYLPILKRLNEYLLPVHVHGNNYSPNVHVNRFGVEIPEALEVTYVSRALIQPRAWNHGAPTPLDQPNLHGAEDLSFKYWEDLSNRYRRRTWARLRQLFRV